MNTTTAVEQDMSAVLVEKGRFLIKIAESGEEIRQAQRLRHEVFIAERGFGPSGMIDADEYDRQFTHLLVIDKEADRTVGTYRMQSGDNARNNLGFYSESEYEIAGLTEIAAETWELGRSCVAADYRSGAVIGLLWAGIAAMHRRNAFRYLIGCASVENVEPETGWGMFRFFKENGFLLEHPYGLAREAFQLPQPRPDSMEYNVPGVMPPLFKGYLKLGAKIAGEPALDRDFQTIDFLVFFDFTEIAERYARHFAV